MRTMDRTVVGLLSLMLGAACGGVSPTEFDDAFNAGADDEGRSSPPAIVASGGQSSTDVTGQACNAPGPAACFTGPAELRGRPGCKDGVRVCEAKGEFLTWGPCVGEVTQCAPPTSAAQPDAGPGSGPDAGGTSSPEEPSGLVKGSDGVTIASPNYTECAKLPSAGKRGYGQCADDHVVVIVNDGKAQEMTCCPIGKNVLSANPAERHVKRTGLCQADEIGTGMHDPNAGVFCTKINANFLKLSAPVQATYTKSNVPGVLGQIAASYNVSDTCICPEGLVVIGGHTPSDNRCEDRCVRVEKR